jgi:hypothetical protein
VAACGNNGCINQCNGALAVCSNDCATDESSCLAGCGTGDGDGDGTTGDGDGTSGDGDGTTGDGDGTTGDGDGTTGDGDGTSGDGDGTSGDGDGTSGDGDGDGAREPPPPPTGVVLNQCSDFVCCVGDNVSLSWDPVAGATYYEVRWNCSITPESISGPLFQTSYADALAPPIDWGSSCGFTTFNFAVYACNANGCSAGTPIPNAPITCGGGCCAW